MLAEVLTEVVTRRARSDDDVVLETTKPEPVNVGDHDFA